MQQPLFTIITVCYNSIDLIEKTIESVECQSFKNYEFIIVDGGSSDGTIDIIKAHSNIITKWISEPDKGIYDAMNKGISIANGVYVNFLNSGDTYYNDNVLLNVSKELDDTDFVCGIAKLSNTGYWVPISKFAKLGRMLYGHNVNHQASFIKREILGNGYDLRYPLIADDVFFLLKIGVQHLSYKRLWIVTNYYDTTGISSNKNNLEKIGNERFFFYSENSFLVKRRNRFSYALYRVRNKIYNLYTYFFIDRL